MASYYIKRIHPAFGDQDSERYDSLTKARARIIHIKNFISKFSCSEWVYEDKECKKKIGKVEWVNLPYFTSWMWTESKDSYPITAQGKRKAWIKK